MVDIYYYVKNDDPYRVLYTKYVGELIDLLYEGKYDLINETQRSELQLDPDYQQQVRKAIGSNQEKVPMYDIYSNRIFLICWENVYERIFVNNYRFIDRSFYTDLENLSHPSDIDQANYRFLSYYDFDSLEKTYLELFYRSFVINTYITHCRRPSFASGLRHIAPYYNMNELNFLAYDWNLSQKITIEPTELQKLCRQIQQYDIPAQVLIDHQLYIYNTKSIGLVKHYSLYGSYYMNQYLRKTLCCISDKTDNNDDIIRNPYLEEQIKIMAKCIRKSPAFPRDHTVYRFISDDSYLSHLRPGDIYEDPSFMSTTRNPFYYKDTDFIPMTYNPYSKQKEQYSFGYVLVKIRLPGETEGVGLSIESYSNFPNEEEIILLPTSRYRLDTITESLENKQFHRDLNLQVHKRYEFTWIGSGFEDEINIELDGSYTPKIKDVNLREILEDDNYRYIPIADRLLYFRDNYTNMNNQFQATIDTQTVVLTMESYNSASVYKPFFYYETREGIMITTADPNRGNISLILEIGYEIHVNYYFRYSIADALSIIDLDTPSWIGWLAALTYAVGSRSVVIHPNYILNSRESDPIDRKIRNTRYPVAQNIYLYMRDGIKLFDYQEITPLFDYFQLDYLKGIRPDEVLSSTDKNELYHLAKSSEIDNLFDFYLFIVETYPELISSLEQRMGYLYEVESNPFANASYRFDAWQYLYGRNMVKNIPGEREFIIKAGSYKRLIGDRAIHQFKNRLRSLASQTSA